MGFSSRVWQILLLRAITAAFSFGGFLASIVLGEVVKEKAGSQGENHSPLLHWSGVDHPSFLIVCISDLPRRNARFDNWRVLG